MTFKDWRRLSAWEAASHVRNSIDALPLTQRKAAIASMPNESTLVARFSSAPQGRALSGIPFFVKDLFETKGETIQAGSSFLKEVRQPALKDAALIEALKQLGAVFVGKTHLYEFAYGLTGENKHFGDCDHPKFQGRTTGGSSSGSALVVAANAVPLSLGTDTAGSLRLPAAFCGLYSFRGIPQETWINDAFPLSQSFDTAGWFTESAEDMLTVLSALVGPLPKSPKPPVGYFISWPGLDSSIADTLKHFAEKLCSEASAELSNKTISIFKDSTSAYTVLQSKETYATHKDWLATYQDRYSPEVHARINRAESWTKEDETKALDKKEGIKTFFETYFKSADFLILPVAPFAALPKTQLTLENRNKILDLTTPGSLAGLPILTLPVPLHSGLTLGLQVIIKDQKSSALEFILAKL